MVKKKVVALLLALIMIVGAASPAFAVSGDPNALAAESVNSGTQEYELNWAAPISSYLYQRQDGGLTRVEYLPGTRLNTHILNGTDSRSYVQTKGQRLVVEDYDGDYHLLQSRELPVELPVWGGFFSGERYNFVIFGQRIAFDEAGKKEVVRVVKYSKDWQRLGDWRGTDLNTVAPFYSGSLRCDEFDGSLIVRTCHRLPNGHQANLSFVLDQEKMEILSSEHTVSSAGTGYVSHSFNQFVIAESDGTMATLDHGDAYPRAFVVNLFPNSRKLSGASSVKLMTFSGETGDNATEAQAGGFASSATHYLASFSLGPHTTDSSRQNVFIYTLDKATLDVNSVQLTSCPEGQSVSNTQMVKLGENSFLVLWEILDSGKPKLRNATLGYAFLDGSGKLVGQVQTAKGALSDCQPIVVEGKALWYTTGTSVDEYGWKGPSVATVPTFYTLGSDGIHAVTTDAPGYRCADWAKAEIERARAERDWLRDEPLIPSYLPADFTQNITRSEFCALGMSIYQFEHTREEVYGKEAFTDTEDIDVVRLAALGVVTGVGDGFFAPDAPLTREQAATILCRLAEVMGYPLPAAPANFGDNMSVSSWAADAVGRVQAAGIMSGNDLGNFDPQGPYTRQEAILTCLRLQNWLKKAEEDAMLQYAASMWDEWWGDFEW